MRRLLFLTTAALLGAAGTLAAVQQPGFPAQPAPLQKGRGVPKAGPAQPTEPAKSEEPAPSPKREAPDGPPEFEAKLVDDSVLKVVLLEPTLTVVTKYGKLAVPVADVLRIEVGFRYPDGVEPKVEEAVTSLGAASYRDREDAEKALLKFGEYAVPALRRAVKNPDPEVARRAEGLLKKLTDKLPAEKLHQKPYDLIETEELTLRGRLEPAAVKVRTKLFGENAVRLADVRTMRSTAVAGNEFTVEASRYGRMNDQNWFDTGIDVTADQALEITASGTVDLLPGQQNGQFVSTPSGNGNIGTGPMMAVNGRAYRYLAGTLIARVGTDGMPFAAGTNYHASRGPGTGRLYLKIMPAGTGAEPTGGYKVKVKVGG